MPVFDDGQCSPDLLFNQDVVTHLAKLNNTALVVVGGSPGSMGHCMYECIRLYTITYSTLVADFGVGIATNQYGGKTARRITF